MLNIKNANGETLISLKDDGTEEVKSQKLKEQMAKAKEEENKDNQKG